MRERKVNSWHFHEDGAPMNRSVIFFLMAQAAFTALASAAAPEYQLHFSTYIGSARWEHARDVVTDSQDNVIVVGGVAGTGLPVTAGAYDTIYNNGVTKGPYAGDHTGSDAFVAKFSPDGVLLWCTYLGGPNYDRAYAVEVDSQDNIVVSGRAGPDFPTTLGAFQPAYAGVFSGSKGFYGYQNAFVAKLSSDGTELMWASYVGKGELCRGVAVDYNDDVFVSNATDPSLTQADPPWYATAFANAYRSTPPGGNDVGIVKIKGDGSQVLWSTWFGGTKDEGGNANVRVDRWGFPYLTCYTESTNIPVTPGTPGQTHSGGTKDIHVAKFSKDGSQLLYGTYLGGNGEDLFETHPTAVDRLGNVFVTFGSKSSNLPLTPGAYNTGRRGTNDTAIVKLTPTFQIAAFGLIGGSSNDNIDGIGVDAHGRVLLSGETQSTDYPVTADAHQSTLAADHDAVVSVLSADLSELLYCTYMGGGAYDLFRGCYMDSKGNIYGAGASVSTNFPTLNPVDSTYGGSNDSRWGNGDAILVKFVDAALFDGDSDNDFLPDDWEMTHFLSLAKNGDGDEDGDGNSNRLEHRQGTDPNNRTSRLSVWIDAAGNIAFSPASVGVDYELRWSRNIRLSKQLWERIGVIPTGTAPASIFDIPAPEASPFLLDSTAPLFFEVLATPLP
jgi:hypothetical protein